MHEGVRAGKRRAPSWCVGVGNTGRRMLCGKLHEAGGIPPTLKTPRMHR